MIARGVDKLPASVDELLGSLLAARLEAVDLSSRKVLAGKMPGERRSKRRGRSVEFDDYRDYAPGDDLRHIDWNVYARFERLVLKLFREEEDLSLHVVLDVSASMRAGTPNKMVWAARLAVALAYIGLLKQNRVSVGVFGASGGGATTVGGLRSLSPGRGRTMTQRFGSFFLDAVRQANAEVGQSGDGDFPGAMRQLTGLHKARGIIIVISDFLGDDLDAGLSYLGAAAMTGATDVYCLRVLSPGEIDPKEEFGGGLAGDLRLTDVESGRASEVTVSPASVAAYRAAFEEDEERLRSSCVSRGIALLRMSTGTAVEDVLLESLRRGGLLK
jgi:uncharacterized protein (DUF58 family)